jgi:hypothetical protein
LASFDEAIGVSLLREKFAIQRGEEPRLRLCGIAQLVTFQSPRVEGVLGQIGCFGLLVG